jgi:tRNA dimethylallyltransferase
MNGVPPLHIITGATAVGKTDTALDWAEKHDAEILSCDSVCVYRHMDIGSAKPNAQQQARIRHHGIDLVEPTERYSVLQFITMARNAIASAQSRGKKILITGGSGFYLAAFFGPVTDDVPISDEIIAEVRELMRQGLPALLARLSNLESGPLPTWLDTQNPIRVAKALERRLATARDLNSLRDEFLSRRGPFADHTITFDLLERPDSELRLRIGQRTQAMLREGLIEEASYLLSLNLDPELASSRAVGYRATMDWLADGRKVALDGLAERINLDTWALVRKQHKWFKRLGLAKDGIES